MTDAFLRPIDIVKELPVSSGATLADFGTGQGHFALALSRVVGEAGTVHAVDILPHMVDKVAKEAYRMGLHNVHARTGDLEKERGSGLNDASAHGVVIVNVLFQAKNPEALLREAARVLRPDGWCAVVDWEASREGGRSIGPAQEHLLSPDDVKEWAEAVGFSFEKKVGGGSHHFGLLFRRS